MVGLWAAPFCLAELLPCSQVFMLSHLLWVAVMPSQGFAYPERGRRRWSVSCSLITQTCLQPCPLCVKGIFPSLKWDRVLMSGQPGASAVTCELLAATPAAE